MMDNDIKEMFYNKNKEIAIKKLLLDFNNNIESLEATVLNITYLEFAIYREKILNIDANLKNKKTVEKLINSYEKKINTKIKQLMQDKIDSCTQYIEKLDIDKNINKYEKKLNKDTDKFCNELSKFIKQYIEKELISKLLISEWYMRNDKKIYFFLYEKLGKDLLEKISSQIKERDVIIYNTANESYEKYLQLNANIE